MNMVSRVGFCLMALFGCLILRDIPVFAQGTSPGYRIDESYIGPGSNLDSGSSNYNIETGQQSLGNTGVGDAASGNTGVAAGATTTNDPTLRCVVETSGIDFGAFSQGVTLTGNATFRVKNYTSYGYNVTIIGNPPTTGNHSLQNLATETASQVGEEQFGINLVANTSPAVFGAFAEQIPDSTFSFGNPTANYDTPNQFRYVSGETVASAPKSSGETKYTISYIINVATDTPGGSYETNQAILCTGTY